MMPRKSGRADRARREKTNSKARPAWTVAAIGRSTTPPQAASQNRLGPARTPAATGDDRGDQADRGRRRLSQSASRTSGEAGATRSEPSIDRAARWRPAVPGTGRQPGDSQQRALAPTARPAAAGRVRLSRPQSSRRFPRDVCYALSGPDPNPLRIAWPSDRRTRSGSLAADVLATPSTRPRHTSPRRSRWAGRRPSRPSWTPWRR